MRVEARARDLCLRFCRGPLLAGFPCLAAAASLQVKPGSLVYNTRYPLSDFTTLYAANCNLFTGRTAGSNAPRSRARSLLIRRPPKNGPTKQDIPIDNSTVLPYTAYPRAPPRPLQQRILMIPQKINRFVPVPLISHIWCLLRSSAVVFPPVLVVSLSFSGARGGLVLVAVLVVVLSGLRLFCGILLARPVRVSVAFWLRRNSQTPV
jgi:hypothetical protein